ncbi:MAG: CcmD family protein [Nitrospinota bacterium]
MSNLSFVIGAFSVIWILFFLYAIYLGRKLSLLEKKLLDLE